MRLIDAKALESVLEEIHIGIASDKGKMFRMIENAPTIDSETLRPHGKWIECDYVKYDGHSECIHDPKAALCCSNCRNAFKKELLWKRNYCPNCGAKMDEEAQTE